MWRIASLFLLQRLNGSKSGDASDINMKTRAVINFFLHGKAPNEIHAILIETIGEHAPQYSAVKNWVAQFKRGRPKTVTTPDIVHKIDELILENRRISAKSIAERRGISRERVGSFIHEDLDVWKISPKWVPKSVKADQRINGAIRLSNFWNFFGAIQMISCRDW